jgi:hypothetical protein
VAANFKPPTQASEELLLRTSDIYNCGAVLKRGRIGIKQISNLKYTNKRLPPRMRAIKIVACVSLAAEISKNVSHTDQAIPSQSNAPIANDFSYIPTVSPFVHAVRVSVGD